MCDLDPDLIADSEIGLRICQRGEFPVPDRDVQMVLVTQMLDPVDLALCTAV